MLMYMILMSKRHRFSWAPATQGLMGIYEADDIYRMKGWTGLVLYFIRSVEQESNCDQSTSWSDYLNQLKHRKMFQLKCIQLFDTLKTVVWNTLIHNNCMRKYASLTGHNVFSTGKGRFNYLRCSFQLANQTHHLNKNSDRMRACSVSTSPTR